VLCCTTRTMLVRVLPRRCAAASQRRIPSCRSAVNSRLERSRVVLEQHCWSPRLPVRFFQVPQSVTFFHTFAITMAKKGKEKEGKGNKEAPRGGEQLELDVDDLKVKMAKALDSMRNDLSNIRIGRANPAILDKVQVIIEGQSSPLLQVAQVSVKDANTILVNPFAPEHGKAIKEAIERADIGITPQLDAAQLRLPIPKPTQDYREKLKVQASKVAEQIKQRVRSIRKDAMDELKKIEKQMSKDKHRATEKQVQTITDDHISKVEAMLKQKEKDIANF